MAERAGAAAARFALGVLFAAGVSYAAPPSGAAVFPIAPPPAAESPAVQSPSPADRMPTAREALTGVLARPEFQRSAAAVWADQVRRRLTRWMADILERLGAQRTGRRDVAKVLAWVVGLGALAALAWWFVRSLVGASQQGSLGFEPARSRRRSARSWARDALAAHRDGDEREAVRCAYRAAVAQIEEYGTWRADESRTPREYLQLLPPAHRHRSVLTDITSRFELAWYGSARPTSDDSRALLTRLKELGCLPSDQAI